MDIGWCFGVSVGSREMKYRMNGGILQRLYTRKKVEEDCRQQWGTTLDGSTFARNFISARILRLIFLE
jgi:hypothetical protein